MPIVFDPLFGGRPAASTLLNTLTTAAARMIGAPDGRNLQLQRDTLMCRLMTGGADPDTAAKLAEDLQAAACQVRHAIAAAVAASEAAR